MVKMRTKTMRIKLLQAKVPIELYKEVEARVRTGAYVSSSEVVREALRIAFANESISRLQQMAKEASLTSGEVMKELNKVRQAKRAAK